MTTIERVIALAASLLETRGDQIRPTDSLTDDLGADSLDILELLMAIEDEFGITDDSLIQRKGDCERISDIVRMVDEVQVAA